MARQQGFGIAITIAMCLTVLSGGLNAEDKPPSAWQNRDLPFRPVNIVSTGNELWTCGTDEGLAVSFDNGLHWQLRHQKRDGSVLLNIDFADNKFGYASGTNGLLLTTVDGGETWEQHTLSVNTLLHASFSDPQHGLIHTRTSLLVTSDGGVHWSSVLTGLTQEQLKEFRFPASLVALDAKHMGVMLSAGPAQYYAKAFVFTRDGGSSWTFQTIPNTTVYSFLRNSARYWVVGTEVIEKDKPGGGYAVPLAMYSADGEGWNRSPSDLSPCRLHTCTLCSSRGCLARNGTVVDIFGPKTTLHEFTPNPEATTKWASTDSSICLVTDRILCANLEVSLKVGETAGPQLPPALSGPALGAGPDSNGPVCIVCNTDPFLIDPHAHGRFMVHIKVRIARNGTVRGAEVSGAPEAINARIRQQAEHWLFEPSVKDGVATEAVAERTVPVAVIAPK